MVNIKEYKSAFDESFVLYKEKFDQYLELLENDCPKSVRLFDIRFRLALSLLISLDPNISYTKTENTRKTYQLLIKLNDIWFAYEGLLGLTRVANLHKDGYGKADMFSNDSIVKFGLIPNIEQFNGYIDENLMKATRSRNDLECFINYLLEHTRGKGQTVLLRRIQERFGTVSSWRFNEILAIVYAVRNMYVHNTDTARSGVQAFRTKIELLKACFDFMVFVNLKISTYVLSLRIGEID